MQNLFEVRKSLRFELKPYKITREILKWEDNYWSLSSKIKHIKEGEFEKEFDWNLFCKNNYSDFIIQSKKLSNFLEKINIEIKKENKDKTKKIVFFDFKRLKWIFKNIPSLKKLTYFGKDFKNKLEEIEENYKIIFDFFEKLEDKETKNEKKSEISKNLRKISYLNRNFLTIFKFFDKYESYDFLVENLEKIKNEIWENFEQINNSIIASNENEKTWTCFWKYTFNKYSLFRRKTVDLENKYKNNKELLNENVKNIIEEKRIKNDNWQLEEIKLETILNIKLEKENKKIQGNLKEFDFDRNLDEVISELDNINWVILNNYIQEFKDKYNDNKNIVLVEFQQFNNKNNYFKEAKLKNLYWKEKNIKIKISKWQNFKWYQYLYLLWEENLFWYKKENQKLANKFLQILFKNKGINKDYNTIKDFRDILAKYRWKVRQDFRASEREFINEAMIKYYAKILEKDWNYFLALTNKNNLDWKIENIEIEKKIDWNEFVEYFIIYEYIHLHFWALEKLCLMWDWDLAINEKLVKEWNKYKNQKKSFEWRCWEHEKYFNRGCDLCKQNQKEKEQNFFSDFQNHIIKSLEKLRDDKKYNWEDWTNFIPKIRELKTIEEIVNFINSNFYKLDKKVISFKNIFKLAQNKEIELFQIYNKDFNIFDENFLSWEDEFLKPLEKWREHWEKTKIINKTNREKDKKKNLFTIYFEEIFKNIDTFLWQEWWIFFRKWNESAEEKRFRTNKFLVTFDIKFNKWKQNHNTKICEKKDKILENHTEKINKYTLEKIKKIDKENLIIIWLDRWKNEHISYWVYDWNLNFEWIIWNTNFIKKIWNNQDKFEILQQWDYENITLKMGDKIIKTEESIYKQLQTAYKYFKEWEKAEKVEKWYILEEWERLLELKWAEEYHIKKVFKQWNNWKYFADLENWWKFILNTDSYWFTILDKNWNKINIVDKNDWKEIIDYYLLFEAEKFKRILEINDQIKYSENMFNLKKWYISIIKDFFNKLIFNYKKEWKEVIFIFENQTSNKKDISNKYLWATILSDIEYYILTKYNYLIDKDIINKLQLTPVVKKEDILSKNNNEYTIYWNCLFINQDNTSSWCPNCKENFIRKWKKGEKLKNWQKLKGWEILEIDWNILYWHWTWDDEWKMKHLTDKEYNNLYEINTKFRKNHSENNNKYLAWKNCSFYLQNPDFSKFNFIKSWDDLATYNIAKKWLEYIQENT